MPDTINWPKLTTPPRRRRGGLIFLIAIIAVIVLGSRTALSYWVDLLWFKSLGYGDVFWKARGLQWGIFAAFAALTCLILFGIFSALKRAHRDDLPSDHTVFIAGQEVKLSLKPVLRIISIGGSLIVAVITGGAMAAQWQTLALWWYAPQTIFGPAKMRQQSNFPAISFGGNSACIARHISSASLSRLFSTMAP